MTFTAENLVFSYSKKGPKVLDGFSCSFTGGEFVTLLGRNGAGKTTFFRNCLGTLKGTGRIEVDGRDLRSMKPRERASTIAYIPQDSKPAFSYSVLTTVLMGTTPSVSTLSSPKEAEVERALSALGKFGIAHLANRKLDGVSGGERQLALCARAVAQEAKVLLFDEPTSNLDWANQIRTLDLIRKLTGDGYLAIVSTHNIEQALNWSTSIILLKDGKVAAQGRPEDIAAPGLLSDFYGMGVEVSRHQGRWLCAPGEVR